MSVAARIASSGSRMANPTTAMASARFGVITVAAAYFVKSGPLGSTITGMPRALAASITVRQTHPSHTPLA